MGLSQVGADGVRSAPQSSRKGPAAGDGGGGAVLPWNIQSSK